jgi:hypothetical protein
VTPSYNQAKEIQDPICSLDDHKYSVAGCAFLDDKGAFCERGQSIKKSAFSS